MASSNEEFYMEPSSWSFVIAPATITSFLLAIILPKLLSPLACGIFEPRTKDISLKMYTHFHTLLSSTIHAIVVVALSVYIILSGTLGTNLIFSKSPLGFILMQISVGYFAGDFVVCLLDPYLRSDSSSLLHHITGLMSILFSLYKQGIFMFFVIYRMTSEVSTPSVNLRWYHYQLGNKDSFWYAFASLSMMVLFFFSRIILIPYHWYYLIQTLLDPQCSVIVALGWQIWIISGFAVFDILNLYWFSKMVKGARKFFVSKKEH